MNRAPLFAATGAIAATASAHKCVNECRNDPKQKQKMCQKKSKNNRFHWFDLRGALTKIGPGFLALNCEPANSKIRPPVEASERTMRSCSVYDELAISKSDQRAMLHLANDLNLQSEILSSFRPGVLVHKSSFPSYTLSDSQAACQTLR